MSIIIEKQTISKSHETEEAKDYGLIIREVGLTGLLAASELDLLDETDYGFEPRHRLDDPESAKKIMQELCRDVSDNKKRPIIKAEFSRKMRKLTGLNGSNGSNNMFFPSQDFKFGKEWFDIFFNKVKLKFFQFFNKGMTS